MKSVRFWILLGGSLSVCALYLFQIYLSQRIFTEQRIMVEGQQIASLGATYESSWKQLATRLYQMSAQDPALAEVLKRNQIQVQPGKPGAAGTAQSAPSIPQTPVTPAAKGKTPGGP